MTGGGAPISRTKTITLFPELGFDVGKNSTNKGPHPPEEYGTTFGLRPMYTVSGATPLDGETRKQEGSPAGRTVVLNGTVPVPEAGATVTPTGSGKTSESAVAVKLMGFGPTRSTSCPTQGV